MRGGALLVATLTASITIVASAVPTAAADGAAACVSYADNIAKARTTDSSGSNWYFAGEYAKALVARFDSIIGGVPSGLAAVASVSAHVYTSNGAQAVDLRFYGSNGCDLGAGASLARFLYTAIVQQIGDGA